MKRGNQRENGLIYLLFFVRWIFISRLAVTLVYAGMILRVLPSVVGSERNDKVRQFFLLL
jgi:hypothetical protein